MGWFGEKFMHGTGRNPEYENALWEIYVEYIQHVDMFKIIRTWYKETKLGVYHVVLYSFIIGLTTFVGLSFLATSLILRNDIGIATVSFNVFIIYLTFAAIFFHAVELLWAGDMRFLDSLVMIVHGRVKHCAYAGNSYDSSLRNKVRIFLRFCYKFFVATAIILSLTIILLPPAYDSIIGEPHPPNDIDNGVAMTLSLPMWTPFDVDHSWIDYFIACTMQFGFCLCCTIFIVNGVFYNVIYQVSVLNEMKLLTKAVEELDIRTTERFKEKYFDRPVDTSSEEYDDCFFDCLKENVVHHQFIQKVFSNYKHLVRYALAIPFLAASIILAFWVAYLFSAEELNPTKKSIILILMMGDISLMVTMCYVGQQIVEENEHFRNALYTTEWKNKSRKVKQAISICMHATSVPMELRIGCIINLNNKNLLLIVNSAYSTFNLFYATQGNN